MEENMQLKILEEQNDESYIRCEPIEEFRIFDVVVDKEETDMFEILIAKGQDLEKLQSVVDRYMDWLNNCDIELTNYLQDQLAEELPIQWMKSIEVYTASIVFNGIDDYGATISFGAECVAGDHIVELYFEKEEIIDNILVG